MKAFKKRGALTHFQILSEISKQDPHLKQKDLAEKLDITIQAVSENIKTLIELGYITSKDGRSPYKITQSGIDKVKKDAISLRKYSDSVLETMNHYKTIWPAIAKEKLRDFDCVIVDVGHDSFKLIDFKSLFKSVSNNMKVLIDVKSILDRNEYLQEGYNIWRL